MDVCDYNSDDRTDRNSRSRDIDGIRPSYCGIKPDSSDLGEGVCSCSYGCGECENHPSSWCCICKTESPSVVCYCVNLGVGDGDVDGGIDDGFNLL